MFSIALVLLSSFIIVSNDDTMKVCYIPSLIHFIKFIVLNSKISIYYIKLQIVARLNVIASGKKLQFRTNKRRSNAGRFSVLQY